MSKLDALINEFCPDGVEYVLIENICKTTTPPKKIFSKHIKTVGKYPVIDQSVELISGYTDDDKAIILKGKYVIFGDHTEIIKYVDFIFAQGADGIKILSTDKCNVKFLYYCFNNYYIRTGNYTRHWGNAKKTKIPLPPLPVQEEIIRILDNFTELTTELTTELKARKKQYEYYRNELLTFGYGVPMVTLGEISEVTKLAGFEFTEHIKYSDSGNIIALRGINIKQGYLDLTNVKYIDSSNFKKLNRSKLYINDMLFTYVGTIGEVALIDKNDKYYLAPNVARIRFTHEKVMPVFMRYYFQTYTFIDNQINRYLSTSSMKNLTMENIRKFKIPIPPLPEQQRIVDILDRFDKLCNDISEGLPAEIKARQQQYEYYRDKLLTFPKAELEV